VNRRSGKGSDEDVRSGGGEGNGSDDDDEDVCDETLRTINVDDRSVLNLVA
jgi:hypothetical protein